MRAANEVFRFLLELAALAAFGYAAAQLVDNPARFALAAVAVVVGVAFWGVLVAPKSTRRLGDPVRLGVEIVFFLVAGGSLVAVGAPWLGIVLAVLGIANAVSLRFLDPVLGALG
jgi:Protein of unknown function (DUF2568)